VLHSFNATGAFLWNLIAASTPCAQLAKRLAEEFETTLDRAERDVAEFMNLCEEKNLLRLTQQQNREA
jgi:hypothetical protein